MDDKKSRMIGNIILLGLIAAIAYLAIFRRDVLNAVLSPDLHWQIFTAEFIVVLFALLAPLIGARDPDRKAMRMFALFGLGGAFVVTLGSLLSWNFAIPGINLDFTLEYQEACAQAIADGVSSPCNVYAVTPASLLFKLIFLGTAFLAVLGSGKLLDRRTEDDYGELFSLILFATVGMMVAASAKDLIVLFLGIEMASLSSYLLAGFQRDRIGAEAAMKYFLFGAVSSGLTLYGISLLYGVAGSTNIAALGTAITTGGAFDAMSFIAIVFFLGGLGFKISSAPFHLWAPDVYSGSPSPVAGMLAAGSKAMGFAAVFNVFLVGLIGVAQNWQLVVAVVAVVSMFVGNLIALKQNSLRRMLAYSSIAQAGYLLIAVVVAGAAAGTNAFGTHATYALGGGMLHLIVNAAMKLGAFLIVGVLILAGIPDRLEAYKGLSKRNAFLALAMAIFLLSMAGIPPLGGFTSKFVLFSAAVDTAITKQLGWLIWLAVFAVANSAISLYYYVRVIRAMYVEGGDEPAGNPIHVDQSAMVAIGVCAGLILLVGVWPSWFVDVSMDAARSLVAMAMP